MTTIHLLSGREVDILNPRLADINLTDIAFSLSNLCRYTGHVNRFYSVAEHALNVSYLVGRNPMICLAALHHDSNESITGDMSSPQKRALLHFGFDYKTLIEKPWQEMINRKFGIWLTEEQWYVVHETDTLIRYDEQRQLKNALPNISEMGVQIVGRDDRRSVAIDFIKRHHNLRGMIENRRAPSKLCDRAVSYTG